MSVVMTATCKQHIYADSNKQQTLGAENLMYQQITLESDKMDIRSEFRALLISSSLKMANIAVLRQFCKLNVPGDIQWQWCEMKNKKQNFQIWAAVKHHTIHCSHSNCT